MSTETDLATAMRACKHTSAIVFAAAASTTPSIPPATARHCPQCGAIHQKGAWTLPTLLTAGRADLAPLHAAVDRIATGKDPTAVRRLQLLMAVLEKADSPDALRNLAADFQALAAQLP